MITDVTVMPHSLVSVHSADKIICLQLLAFSSRISHVAEQLMSRSLFESLLRAFVQRTPCWRSGFLVFKQFFVKGKQAEEVHLNLLTMGGVSLYFFTVGILIGSKC